VGTQALPWTVLNICMHSDFISGFYNPVKPCPGLSLISACIPTSYLVFNPFCHVHRLKVAYVSVFNFPQVTFTLCIKAIGYFLIIGSKKQFFFGATQRLSWVFMFEFSKAFLTFERLERKVQYYPGMKQGRNYFIWY
jgi:hypothetical protein